MASPWGKRTIRSELERIPEYTTRSRRHGSFYMANTKKTRLEEERNTEIEKNNRMLYEKIRKIMLKGRSRSENKSSPMLPEMPQNKQMMLTFMKTSELPQLQPLSSRSKPKSSLNDILEHRSKYINGYFESINEARENLRNKVGEQLEAVVVGKWTVHGVIYDDCVVLRGVTGDRELSKKYPYARVALKVREHYKEWVNDKFGFEE